MSGGDKKKKKAHLMFDVTCVKTVQAFYPVLNVGFGVRLPGFESHLCHSLADLEKVVLSVRPPVSYPFNRNDSCFYSEPLRGEDTCGVLRQCLTGN